MVIGVLDKVRDIKKNGVPVSDKPFSTQLRMTEQEALQAFGHTSFRDGQEEAVKEVLYGRSGVLLVYPTGHGKSLVFELPSLMVDEMTIVVSPLIALMKDQVDKLRKLGIDAIFINSSMTPKEQREALGRLMRGEPKMVYVSPERFTNNEFNRAFNGLDVGIFAVDEAHCISRWGHDFRRAYSKLGEVIERVKPRQVIAATATATRKVQDDICKNLGIPKAKRFVRSVHRPNLILAVVEGSRYSRLNVMASFVADFHKKGQRTGVIYSSWRSHAEDIGSFLNRNGIPATVYHGGKSPKVRTAIQDEWADNGGTIVATSAFGMGIDKPDVRFVIHDGLSQSIEEWYQESGRAGRDGNEALCLSFWDDEPRGRSSDWRVQEVLINQGNPRAEDVEMLWVWLRDEARSQANGGEDAAILNLTQKEMEQKSGCYSASGCMTFLYKKGAVKKLARGRYEVSLKVNGSFDYSELTARREERLAKIQEVVQFYKSAECRSALVCDHFGDDSFKGPCTSCDNCNP